MRHSGQLPQPPPIRRLASLCNYWDPSPHSYSFSKNSPLFARGPQLSLGKPAASPPAVTASPSPFAAAAGAPPPHMFGRASLDFARPLLSPGHSVFGRASMDSRPLPPLERHLRSAATAPPIPCWAPGGGGSSGGYSGNGSYSSTGSGPESPGTPTAAPPMLRKLSMQRTASIRRLDSLADMNIG